LDCWCLILLLLVVLTSVGCLVDPLLVNLLLVPGGAVPLLDKYYIHFVSWY